MAAAYDNYDYPSYWEGRTYEHKSEVIAINSFFTRIGKDKKVLEIGAGYGRLAKVYDKFSRSITLADPSSGILKQAKEYLKDSNTKMSFVRSTLENLPKKVPTKKYDVIVLVRVMHHIKDPKAALSMVASYLPAGGYLILEFANKLHGKAILNNILKGNFTFPLDIFPIDKRSKKNVKKHSIPFLNHHPDMMVSYLENSGFKVVDKRSVSNIRNSRVKKMFPLGVLEKIESFIQKPLAKVNFGPSVFILAKKK